MQEFCFQIGIPCESFSIYDFLLLLLNSLLQLIFG